MITFHVPGRPQPQGSKKHVGGGVMIESAEDLGPWRERVALAAKHAMGQRPLMEGPLVLVAGFIMPRPVQTPKKRTPPAIKRPDLDKLVRAVDDALQGIVFAADSQITRIIALKRLAQPGEGTGVTIRIREDT